MNKQFKRIIALTLCVIMLFGVSPVNGLAELDFSRLASVSVDFAPVKALFSRISDLHIPEIRLPDFSEMLALKASADDPVADIVPNFIAETGTLTLSGTGKMPTYTSSSPSPWDDYKSSIKTLIIKDGITSISDSAFKNCKSLENITIPDSVTSIDANALSRCEKLMALNIPSVQSIGKYAFACCYSLTRAELSNNLSTINEGTFKDCRNLTEIQIPNGVMDIGNEAFYYCSEITCINIPDSVSSIGKDAFRGCSEITRITIPNSVSSIGENAFYGCSGLKTAGPVGEGYDYSFGWTEKIPENAFKGLDCLESIFIPKEIVKINGALGCGNLNSISVSTENTKYKSAGNCLIDIESKTLISGCNSSVIPNDGSVTKIGGSAFYGCSKIQHLDIPDTIRSIGYYAFQNCSNLETVSLPGSSSGYTRIGNRTFYGCQGLKRIIIPEQITEIGQYAFYSCTNLNYISIPKNVKKILEFSFSGCNKLYTVVYTGSLSEWCSIYFADASVCPLRCAKSFIVNNKVLEEITQNNLSDITTICRFAFVGYSNLKKVDLCNSIQVIGDYAFSSCNNLTDVTLPNSVTTIGKAAFASCSSLLDITIPDSVTSIVSNAFSFTPTTVFYSGSATGSPWSAQNHYNYYEGDIAFSDSNKTRIAYCKKSAVSVKLSDNVVSIADEAFADCTFLDITTIPDGVNTIGFNAFYDVCNVQYSGSATGSPWGARSVNGYIDGNLIYSDKSMTELLACSPAAKGLVIVPASVQTVADKAFFNCKDIERIVFKMRDAEPPAFGSNVFLGCSKLTDVTLLPFGDGSEVKGDIIFGDYGRRLIFCNRDRGENESEKTYTIPDYVEVIEDNAFANCTKLNVIIPENNNIVSVGSNAFYNTTVNGIPFNTATRTVTGDGKAEYLLVSGILLEVKKIGDENFSFSIPSGTTCIAAEAFKELPGLTSVTIPSGVRGIGRDAFSGCSSLTGVTANTNSLIYVGANAFDSTPFYDNATGSLYVGNALVKAAPDGSFTVTGTCVADGAMKNCETLEALNLNNVEYIGKSAFENCGNLSTVTFGSGLVSIGDHAFAETGISGNVVIPSSVENIGYCAFKNCAEITGFEADGNNNVFTDDCGVLFVKATDKVTGNSKIILVQYPAAREIEGEIKTYTVTMINGTSVAKIEDYAFSNADLVEVNVGSTYFRTLAFANCAAVRNTSGDDSEWVGGIIEYKENRTVLCQVTAEALNNGSFKVPDSVLVIAPRAFESVGKNLKSVNLNGTRIISESAFEGCDELSAVTGFDNVVFIGDLAFAGCKKIEEVSLPNKIYCSPTAFYEEVNIPKNYLKIDVADNVAYGDSVTLSTDYTPGENEKIIWIWTECEFNGDEMTPVDKTAEGKQITINNVSHNITVSAYLVEVEDANAEVTHGRTASGITFENATVIMESNPDVPVIINAEITERQHDITKVDVIYANIGDKVPLSLGADKEADNQELENLINDYGDILEIRWYSGKDKDIKQIGTGPSCEITVAKYGKVTLTVKFIYTGGKKEIGLATITKSITFKKPDSAVSIKAKSAEVYNNSVVTVKATASGVPDGCVLAVYEGKKLMQKGDSKSVTYEIPGKLTKDKTLTVKIIDGQGKVQKDANGKEISEKIEIKIKSGFFNMIIAFFRMLFGLNKVTIEP